jgi:hypothetical protein
MRALIISAMMLLPVTASADVLGQSAWCFVPPGSETLYCDYVAYGSCVDSNREQVTREHR